jgi:small GTP-binding protein
MATLKRDQILFKAIIVGDPAVGKTAIRHRYMGAGFKANYLMTLGADFAIKRLDKYVIQIWDLAGQYSYKTIRKGYYSGAIGGFLVFDLTQPVTFDHLQLWIDEYLMATGKMIPMILVGNKQDSCASKECIDKQEIENFRQKLISTYGFNFPFYETSALTGLNIDEIFSDLIEEVELIRKTFTFD